jgi:hypothetical protein
LRQSPEQQMQPHAMPIIWSAAAATTVTTMTLAWNLCCGG